MKNVIFHSQSGKSLIEMVIVVAITAIVVTYAVTRLGSAQSNLNRQNIARELKVSLERARFDSVKRRPSQEADMARVTVSSATSFSLTLDLNQNGAIDASDTRQTTFPNTRVKIVGNGLIFPLTIKFDRYGQTVATNGIGMSIDSPVFLICEGCTSWSSITAANSNLVTISPTGTVAMLNGGQTPPTGQNPTVSTVSNNADINSLVTVGGSGTTTSPTPTPVPTATPPNPSPTPTQSVCLRNQRPSQDNCICLSPMLVRGSGKCQ